MTGARASLADLSAVVAAHARLHPALRPQDVYKLLYQRVFGPEHSVPNTRAAWGRLHLEILELPATPTTLPLYETLSPVLGRVNLQPLQQQGLSVAVLWSVFRDTLTQFQPGTLEDLLMAWQLALATPWAQGYDPSELVQFWQQMATADFPAVHHSPAYRTANQPHYRVVLRELAVARRLWVAPALA